MIEDAPTSVYDFRRIWSAVPNKQEIEATATLSTIGHASSGKTSDESDLPRVDHLMAMGEVLGQGGNGEVLSAEQASLRRLIAVKRPRGGADLGDRLLREARVIGFLEHPNIPPVHFVGSGEHDALLVGLKRIEGETLTARLERERPLQSLDDNLDILVHICNAVGYAHSRGILHLDLKPDNIMTGHFGEVYVLDWGLAAAYRDDVTAEISRVGSDRVVRGTPAFMAPEMVTSEGLDATTDVYLLGGLLHFILTHKPPNAGDSAVAAMQSAYEPSPRVFGEAVPRPLAEICRKALAFEQRDRYGDADEFRAAIAEYRRERRELEAIATAQLQLGQFDEILAANPEDTAAIYKAYGAARQAIDEAARLQRDDAQTRPMLQSVLDPMIRWELDRENVGGAELLLAELPTASPRLAAAVEEQRRRRLEAHEELQALRREVDPDVGAKTKALVTMGVGVTIAAMGVVPYLLQIPPTVERVLAGYVVYLAVLLGITYAGRRALFQTRTNRSLTHLVWVLSLFGFSVRLGAYFEQLPLSVAIGYDLTLVWMLGTLGALTMDRRLFVGMPFYFLGACIVFALPGLALVTFGVTHFLGLTSIAVAIVYGSTRATA